MSKIDVTTPTALMLPPSIVSKVDLARLISEFERIDNELTTAEVRTKTGSATPPTPLLSEQLTDFLAHNTRTLGKAHERSELMTQLRLLREKVPVVHMTFAVPADRDSLQQIAQWLRSSVHAQAVIAVGLQPALVAGVYMRTPNHVLDLSVRGLLAGRRDILVKELGALRGNS